MRIQLLAVWAFAASLPLVSHADLQPQQFDSVALMIEDFGDYSAENQSFSVLQESPLSIQLAPTVFANDLPENITRELRRAALYGLYRSLIHTDANTISVRSVPLEVTLNPSTQTLLKRPRLTIEATREQALAAVQHLVGVDVLAELVVPEKTGDFQLDSWRKGFEHYYHSDAGQIELLEALLASGAKVRFLAADQ